MVEGATDYLLFYVLSIFLIYFIPFLWCIPVLLIVGGLAYAIISKAKRNVGGSLLPAALYFLTVGQEIYGAFTSAQPNAYTNLGLWYFGGLIFMLVIGRIIGWLLKILFPVVAEENIAIMKREFGERAPKVIEHNDGSRTSGFATPGDFAGMIVGYAIWMILRHFILPF